MTVRVRFAPSPTGYLHVGGARTALYNWIVARQAARTPEGGTFVLRIEDTDTERNRPEWTEGILESLSWLGLHWDEGPLFQSQRLALYREAADRLLASGHAYWCGCTRQEVLDRTSGAAIPGYDRHCRDLGLEAGPGRALRFRAPDDGASVMEDVVRGTVVIEHRVIEDFVLVKSTGTPLFVLANVVDDIDMGITHVIRGEEHLPNTPKTILVWQALGGVAGTRSAPAPLPIYAHLPLLVNERRQKLSKRRDRVAVEDYRAQGYLAEVLTGYLAMLGWGHGDDEPLSLDELVRRFSLEDVGKSPAFFDEKKLAHFNGLTIRRMSPDAFVEASAPWLDAASWPKERFDPGVYARIAPLVQERVITLGEVPAMAGFLFVEEPEMDGDSWKRVMEGDTPAADILAAAEELYAGCDWEAGALHGATAALAARTGRSLAKFQAPVRVAITGNRVGPPLFESLVLLGREATLARIRRARELVVR